MLQVTCFDKNKHKFNLLDLCLFIMLSLYLTWIFEYGQYASTTFNKVGFSQEGIIDLPYLFHQARSILSHSLTSTCILDVSDLSIFTPEYFIFGLFIGISERLISLKSFAIICNDI